MLKCYDIYKPFPNSTNNLRKTFSRVIADIGYLRLPIIQIYFPSSGKYKTLTRNSFVICKQQPCSLTNLLKAKAIIFSYLCAQNLAKYLALCEHSNMTVWIKITEYFLGTIWFYAMWFILILLVISVQKLKNNHSNSLYGEYSLVRKLFEDKLIQCARFGSFYITFYFFLIYTLFSKCYFSVLGITYSKNSK